MPRCPRYILCLALLESKSQLKALQFDRGIPVEPWFAGFIAIPAGTSTAPWSLACVMLDRQACVWGEGRISVFSPFRSFPPPPPPLLLSLAPLAGFPSSIFKISINLQASHLNCYNLISYAIRCLRLKKKGACYFVKLSPTLRQLDYPLSIPMRDSLSHQLSPDRISSTWCICLVEKRLSPHCLYRTLCIFLSNWSYVNKIWFLIKTFTSYKFN